MIGCRFVIAGLILLLFTKAKDWLAITKKQLLNAYLIGTLFMTLSVGSTVWGQVYLDSGIACLICGTNPLMVVLIMWGLNGEKVKPKAFLGVFLGLIGLMVLVFQNEFVSQKSTLFGIGIILFAVFSWSVGTVLIPKLDLPKSKSQTTALQITWIALGYLILFGSLIAFSAFNYLLTKVSPSKVATSAYVNPIIAVFLGWWFRHEIITVQTLIAAAIMILGVFFINSSKVAASQ